ncbi:flagellar biosynthetic protein FliO [Pseudomonas sp. UL073]|uniref:Flagellar protein n=1 Tax=Zestomonas insulae TaxID=2809017 RepID=A0ABS2IA58_9GAMM|nr:flagellar biosynthetic protein FliO [Pseudomonas insulae]MBM7059548.1 flagellar biosynthetic protein FliO [Pseudomonas insulae]
MRALFFVLCGLPLSVLAAEPAKTVAPVAPMASTGMAGQLGQLLFGLLLVVGLIFLLAWLLRRVQQITPRGNQAIRIIASQALGPRDRLVLVEVGHEQVLLGVSAGRINTLHVLNEPVETASGESATPEFAQRLMELLGRDHKGKS